jgi:SAM-dependent methyltransferase
MYDDVTELNLFYKTPLGQHLAGQMRAPVSAFWRGNANSCNVALGYGFEWLDHNNPDPASLIALLPARFGVAVWPKYGAVRSALVDGHALPLSDVYVDRLLVAHALEFDPDPGRLLDECWRLLDGAGRLLVVVPNRRGLWARIENTPIGHGRPYSSQQLCKLLKTHRFVPRRIKQAMFLPPINSKALIRLASGIEQIGQRWWPALGGVLLIEAEKMLYAAAGNTSKKRSRGASAAPVVVAHS